MGKLRDRLKIVYINIFFLVLFLSLFYTVAKDFFPISNSSYGLIYLTTLVIALISYASYHRANLDFDVTFQENDKINVSITERISRQEDEWSKNLEQKLNEFKKFIESRDNSAKIREKGHKKSPITYKIPIKYKIIWHRIVERLKKVRHEKEKKEHKKELRKIAEKHKLRILKPDLKSVYSFLAAAALFLSLVSIVYSAWIFFVLLLAVSLFSLFSLKKLAKTTKPTERSIMIKYFLNSKRGYETDIDKLLEFINKNKAVKLSDVTSSFNISKEKAEVWGKILAEHGLIKLHYPAAGELILINNEYKVPHPDARIMFKYFLIMVSIVVLFVLLLLAKIYLI